MSAGLPRTRRNAPWAKIPGVTRYMDELVEAARRQGYASTILGRKRRIPELSRRGAARAYGGRIAPNTPIQDSAADILKKAMIAVERELDRTGLCEHARMLLTVHDELIFECDRTHVAELIGLARPAMEGAAKLDVPLSVESGSGKSWPRARAECARGAVPWSIRRIQPRIL